jgi:hypothetical protein
MLSVVFVGCRLSASRCQGCRCWVITLGFSFYHSYIGFRFLTFDF